MGWMPLEDDAREILESCHGVVESRFVELAGPPELTLAEKCSVDFEETLCADEGTAMLGECGEVSNRDVVVATDSAAAPDGCSVATQYFETIIQPIYPLLCAHFAILKSVLLSQ